MPGRINDYSSLRNELGTVTRKGVDELSGDQQSRVQEFVERPGSSRRDGIALDDLQPLVGTIGARSAVEMTAAMEEACEQVNADEW